MSEGSVARLDAYRHWTRRAACAGSDTERFFTDEVSDGTKLEFPETVFRAMKVCFACPVRRECLAEAYATERHVEAMPGTVPVRHHTVEDKDRYGVRGGVPGQIRQRHSGHPDRLGACERWFQAVARKRRWGIAAVMDGLWRRVLTSDPTIRPTAQNGG